MAVKLGKKYRDSISGFEGIATARYTFLHGCERILLEGGIGEDGKVRDLVVDEQRLTDTPKATSGGPMPGPPPRDPRR